MHCPSQLEHTAYSQKVARSLKDGINQAPKEQIQSRPPLNSRLPTPARQDLTSKCPLFTACLCCTCCTFLPSAKGNDLLPGIGPTPISSAISQPTARPLAFL